jgi:hypothetical protein
VGPVNARNSWPKWAWSKLTGVALLRGGSVSKRLAWTVIVGALLCIPPLPVRFVVIVVVAERLARRQ